MACSAHETRQSSTLQGIHRISFPTPGLTAVHSCAQLHKHTHRHTHVRPHAQAFRATRAVPSSWNAFPSRAPPVPAAAGPPAAAAPAPPLSAGPAASAPLLPGTPPAVVSTHAAGQAKPPTGSGRQVWEVPQLHPTLASWLQWCVHACIGPGHTPLRPSCPAHTGTQVQLCPKLRPSTRAATTSGHVLQASQARHLCLGLALC